MWTADIKERFKWVMVQTAQCGQCLCYVIDRFGGYSMMFRGELELNDNSRLIITQMENDLA